MAEQAVELAEQAVRLQEHVTEQATAVVAEQAHLAGEAVQAEQELRASPVFVVRL